MISSDVIVENKLWKNKIKNPKIYIKKKIKKIFKLNYLKNKNCSLTILLTNNLKMKYLNNKFRNRNKTTDVLSFPNFPNININKKNNSQIYLGDIAFSYEIINQRSKHTNFELEFDKLLIHGYLHLLGYDHQKNRDYKAMKKLEDKIFDRL
tara:strand:+ start:2030 stop:2482 length:453 start_codon:yes stop_codon:yes gene_type:complete